MFMYFFRLIKEITRSPIFFVHLVPTQEKTFIGFTFDIDRGVILSRLI